MPPSLFDDMQIANAIQNEALPSLERLAQNPSLHDRTFVRFDADKPPPYTSSTEDESEDQPVPYEAPGSVDRARLDELYWLLDEPLDSHQTDKAAAFLQGQSRAYCPGVRYEREAKLEKERVKRWTVYEASDNTRKYFIQYGLAAKGRACRERINIIVRRNIKRRWQKLGVWNPEWGFPGRANPRPHDNTDTWKWRWQHGEADVEWVRGPRPMLANSRHPSARALRLRQGQHRSEHSPVLPRSRLNKDAPASQAESFIVSRPWFLFAVETHEEEQRYWRLPDEMRRLYKYSPAANVKEIWKERGDWKADWEVTGWKWRHESPSPEPEDLSGLEDLASFELTPSEVDALEAVRPPTPPPAPQPWIPPPGEGTGLFGGPKSARPGVEQAAEQPAASDTPPAMVQAHREPPAAGDDPSQQPQPRRRSRRLQPPSQPLRRSARITAMTADHQPPPPVPKPPARRRAPPRKKRTAR